MLMHHGGTVIYSKAGVETERHAHWRTVVAAAVVVVWRIGRQSLQANATVSGSGDALQRRKLQDGIQLLLLWMRARSATR